MSKLQVARAYDAAASTYDSQLAGDEWVRDILWEHYARVFRPGQQILDAACGTGIDSLFLASRGVRVTGVDVSGEMVDLLRAKAAARGLTSNVRAHVLDISELAQNVSHLLGDEKQPPAFDGIVSGFAGLNTLPELESFATAAARLLRPEGRMIVHMLNRFSMWEWLGLVGRGRWAAASSLGRQPERIFVIGGVPVKHTLYWPQRTYGDHFSMHFRLVSAYGVGALRPPAGAVWMPAPILSLLDRLERRYASSRPFLNWGRFFVLDMVRKQEIDLS